MCYIIGARSDSYSVCKTGLPLTKRWVTVFFFRYYRETCLVSATPLDNPCFCRCGHDPSEGASAHRARAPRAPRAEADASLTGEMHTFFRQVPPF